MDKALVIQKLNRILELELAGVVRYTHYALMVYGINRIPIVKWLEKQAEESFEACPRGWRAYYLLRRASILGHRSSVGNLQTRD